MPQTVLLTPSSACSQKALKAGRGNLRACLDLAQAGPSLPAQSLATPGLTAPCLA